MRLHVCGSRGSSPTPGIEFAKYGGHTSCVAVEGVDGRPDLIIDAGTGLRVADGLFGGHPFEGVMLLGHLHWDHTQGLPFFRAGDRDDARVDVYVPAQDLDPLAALERMMSPPNFPITPTELKGAWTFLTLEEGLHQIGRYEVTAREIPHKGGRTFGYRIDDGRASIAYLSDHHPLLMGEGPDGHGVVHEAALDLADGVDLLIHDAQFVGEDWPTRRQLGHSTPTYAARLAREANAQKVLLFHHDPARTDDQLDELAAAWAGTSEPDVLVAQEGMTLDAGAQ